MDEGGRAEFTGSARTLIEGNGIARAQALLRFRSRGFGDHFALKNMHFSRSAGRHIDTEARAEVDRITSGRDYREPLCRRRHIGGETPAFHVQALRGLKAKLRRCFDHDARAACGDKRHRTGFDFVRFVTQSRSISHFDHTSRFFHRGKGMLRVLPPPPAQQQRPTGRRGDPAG